MMYFGELVIESMDVLSISIIIIRFLQFIVMAHILLEAPLAVALFLANPNLMVYRVAEITSVTRLQRVREQ